MIAPTRWKLRKAVKVVNEILAELKVEQHPDKTFIGRVERGFDFLGYSFKPGLLCVAEKTVENMKERIARLYEQGAAVISIGQYVRRWLSWVCAGVGGRIKQCSLLGTGRMTHNIFDIERQQHHTPGYGKVIITWQMFAENLFLKKIATRDYAPSINLTL